MTKFAIAVVFIVAAAIVGVKSEVNKEELLKTFMKDAEACVAEVGATPADIQDMIKKQPASSYEAKCLRACVMKKCGVMSADGKMTREGALEKARYLTDNDAEKMKIAAEIVDICIAKPISDDSCEAAEQYGQCFKDEYVSRNIHMD